MTDDDFISTPKRRTKSLSLRLRNKKRICLTQDDALSTPKDSPETASTKDAFIPKQDDAVETEYESNLFFTPKKQFQEPIDGQLNDANKPSPYAEPKETVWDDSMLADEAVVCCPVCYTVVSSADADAHVNACLDAEVTADGVAETEFPLESAPLLVETALTDHRQATVANWKSMFGNLGARIGKTVGYGLQRVQESLSQHLEVHSTSTVVAGLETGVDSVLLSVEATEVVTLKSVVAEPLVAPASGDTTQTKKPAKSCPFYKRIPTTKFAVDAFSYGMIPGVTGYFLSHYHADHYGGLSKSFGHGIIYCSQVTANLVIQELRVDPIFIKALPLNTLVQVDGVEVYLMDANHCPGAVLFLFTVPSQFGRPYRYLHTGDFRALRSHAEEPILRSLKLDVVYLDTTYCNPQYVFPSQQTVIQEVTQLCIEVVLETCHSHQTLDWLVERKHAFGKKKQTKAKRKETKAEGTGNQSILNWLKPRQASVVKTPPAQEVASVSPSPVRSLPSTLKASDSRTLILVGTYTIGKERVFLGIARALNCKIYANNRKTKILNCIEDPELNLRLTDDPWLTCLHVVRMGDLNIEFLSKYLAHYQPRYENLIAFRPTGWTFSGSSAKSSSDEGHVKLTALDTHRRVAIFGVPYSEHSSFAELEEFIRALHIGRVIPTVNVGNERRRKEMNDYFQTWLHCPSRP